MPDFAAESVGKEDEGYVKGNFKPNSTVNKDGQHGRYEAIDGMETAAVI